MKPPKENDAPCENKLLAQLTKNQEPGPIKPSEKAITYKIPKQRIRPDHITPLYDKQNEA